MLNSIVSKMVDQWLPLLQTVLYSQARKVSPTTYVAAGSWCIILSGPEPIITVDEDNSKIKQYIIKAALTNLDQRRYTTATFLVPSKEPAGSITSFKTAFDAVYGIYRIEPRIPSPLKCSVFSMPLFDAIPVIKAAEEPDHSTTSSLTPSKDMEGMKTAVEDKPEQLKIDGPIDIEAADQATPVVNAQVTTAEAKTEVSSLVAEDLLKRPHFEWRDEFEELGVAIPSKDVQVQEDTDGKQLMGGDADNLLKPSSFEWGDESEVLKEAPLNANIQDLSKSDVEAPSSYTFYGMPTQDYQADAMAGDVGSSGAESSSSSDFGEIATPDTPLSECPPLALAFEAIIDKVKGNVPSSLLLALDLAYFDKPGLIKTSNKFTEWIWMDLTISATQRTKDFPAIPWRVKFVSPNIRGLIPQYSLDDVNRFFENFPAGLQTDYGWGLAHKFVEWDYMVLASQVLREQGQYKRRHLKPHIKFNSYLERLVDYKARSTSKAVQPSSPNGLLHHYNFMQLPVKYPSTTPPEVSLWAAYMFNAKAFEAVSSGAEPYLDPFSHKGVLVSQASKLIDPFVYDGPEYLLHLYKGSKLRDQLTGYVRKVYRPNGTWHNDRYEYEQEKPRAVYEVESFNDIDDFSFGPQPSIFIDAMEDLRIPSINDDGRPQKLPPPERWIKAVGWDRKGLPRTKLSTMENVTDTVVDAEVEGLVEKKVTFTLPAPGNDRHSLPVLRGCDICLEQIEGHSDDDEDESIYGRVLDMDGELTSQSTATVDDKATEPCGDSGRCKELEVLAEYSPLQPELLQIPSAGYNDAMEGIIYGGIDDKFPQPDEDLFTAALQQEILTTVLSTEEAESLSMGEGINEVTEDFYTAQQSLFQHDGIEGTRPRVRLGLAEIKSFAINSNVGAVVPACSKHLKDEESEGVGEKNLGLADGSWGADDPRVQDEDSKALTSSGDEDVTNADAGERARFDDEEVVTDVLAEVAEGPDGEENSVVESMPAVDTDQKFRVSAAVGQEPDLGTEARAIGEPDLLLPTEINKSLTNRQSAAEKVTINATANEVLLTPAMQIEQAELLPVLQSPWANRNDLAEFPHKVDFNEYFFGTFAIGIGHQALKAMSWIDKVIRY